MLRLAPPEPAVVDAFFDDAVCDDRDPVLSRWARARALGVREDAAAHPTGVGGQLLVDKRARLDRALARLVPMTELLATRPLITLLADPDGVVVWSAPGRFHNRAAEARLVDGAVWSEQSRGTNAIGTALVERRDVAVIGGAHYEEKNRRLVCYATPLIDAYGELVGVLDVTGDVVDDDPGLAPLVQRVGGALREAMRVEAWLHAGGASVVERMLDRLAVPAVLVERTRQQKNERARALFGDADVFAAGFDALADAAVAGVSVVVDGRRVQLEPVLGQGGRVLSVMACFDSLARRPTTPSSTSTTMPPSQALEAPSTSAFAPIAGSDAAVVRAKALAGRFAPTSIPVLLLAETGTGKELMARAIHAASKRAAGPFVAINCGALSPALLESELFGYVAGAFTGARPGGSEGKLAAASGGTLFLDEMAEMSPPLQAMLLRVLEDGSYSRLGESTTRKADFRLIGATCRDLPAAVQSGAFRSDLYDRMHGASLTLPPLRDRSDRLELARVLVDVVAAAEGVVAADFDVDAADYIERHPWPGNVRELKNAVRHALLLCSDGLIRAADFPAPLPSTAMPPPDSEAARIARALRDAGGNRAEAARLLGVARSTFYRMLDRQKPLS